MCNAILNKNVLLRSEDKQKLLFCRSPWTLQVFYLFLHRLHLQLWSHQEGTCFKHNSGAPEGIPRGSPGVNVKQIYLPKQPVQYNIQLTWIMYVTHIIPGAAMIWIDGQKEILWVGIDLFFSCLSPCRHGPGPSTARLSI